MLGRDAHGRAPRQTAAAAAALGTSRPDRARARPGLESSALKVVQLGGSAEGCDGEDLRRGQRLPAAAAASAGRGRREGRECASAGSLGGGGRGRGEGVGSGRRGCGRVAQGRASSNRPVGKRAWGEGGGGGGDDTGCREGNR